MSFDFKKVAQEQTLLSPVMMNREKLSTEEVVNKELTIIEFGFAPKFDEDGSPVIDQSTGESDTFGVVIFDEMPDRYYCVGSVFTKVCHSWAAGFESVAEASEALKNEGGVKVRFSEGKTKRGKNLVKVDIL